MKPIAPHEEVDAAACAFVAEFAGYRREENIPEETLERFERWLEADPRNQPAYRKMQQSWARFQQIIKHAERIPPAAPSSSRFFPSLSRAASYLLGAALVLSPHYLHESPAPLLCATLSTAVGAYRCDKLPDHSDMCLNTDTHIRYAFTRELRYIELLSGEASFVVHEDESRPFYVRSGRTVVRDLSTSFDVYKKQGSTLVTVIDGHVKVAALELHKLQQVELNEVTGSVRVHPDLSEKQLARLQAWKQGRIDFDGMTLGEALEELSRYQSGHHFAFSDQSIRDIPVDGDMRFTEPDEFLLLLRRFGIQHSVTRTRDGARVTLSRSRKTPSPLMRQPQTQTPSQ